VKKRRSQATKRKKKIPKYSIPEKGCERKEKEKKKGIRGKKGRDINQETQRKEV